MSEDGQHKAHDVRMIDVGSKPVTVREAVASGSVRLAPEALQAVIDGACAKGDVFTVARLAGIQAAKRTSDIVPLCHPIPINSIEVDVRAETDRIAISCTARAEARTGVEMEALTGVAVAALTVIDMTKGIAPGGVVENVRLESKTGGVHGDYHRSS